jgi:hypothetical protein
MKKYYLFVALSLALLTGLTAQSTSGRGRMEKPSEQAQPPQEIVDKFTKEHPGITPAWHMDGKNFAAEYVDPNTFKGISIVYAPDGSVLRRESEMENSSYPAGINDYYIKKYPGEKFKTWRSLDDKGVQSYYIKRANETVWFDQEGRYIDPEKKNGETAASK